MCLATAYLNKGSDEPVLRDIAHLRFDGETVAMETLFGEEKVISGRLLEVDFSTSKIILDVSNIKGDSSKSSKA